MEAKFTPEQRTAILADKYVDQLADDFLKGGGIVISLPDNSRKIQVFEVEPFAKDPTSHLKKVGRRWKAMEGMKTLQLWNPVIYGITQSLIVSKDSAGVGACVRITEAEYFDPESGLFVPKLVINGEEFLPKERYIAKYLGLPKNELSDLRFMDDTNTLYLFKQVQQPKIIKKTIDSEQANQEIIRLCNL